MHIRALTLYTLAAAATHAFLLGAIYHLLLVHLANSSTPTINIVLAPSTSTSSSSHAQNPPHQQPVIRLRHGSMTITIRQQDIHPTTKPTSSTNKSPTVSPAAAFVPPHVSCTASRHEDTISMKTSPCWPAPPPPPPTAASAMPSPDFLSGVHTTMYTLIRPAPSSSSSQPFATITRAAQSAAAPTPMPTPTPTPTEKTPSKVSSSLLVPQAGEEPEPTPVLADDDDDDENKGSYSSSSSSSVSPELALLSAMKQLDAARMSMEKAIQKFQEARYRHDNPDNRHQHVVPSSSSSSSSTPAATVRHQETPMGAEDDDNTVKAFRGWQRSRIAASLTGCRKL